MGTLHRLASVELTLAPQTKRVRVQLVEPEKRGLWVYYYVLRDALDPLAARLR